MGSRKKWIENVRRAVEFLKGGKAKIGLDDAVRAVLKTATEVQKLLADLKVAQRTVDEMLLCPLSRSLSGAKRTYPFALHMSAFDPKRTSVMAQKPGLAYY